MIRVVKLTSRNGDPIWVNSAQVIHVAEYVNTTGVGAELHFALVGSTDTEPATGSDHAPYRVRVTETAETVVALMLAPFGLAAR